MKRDVDRDPKKDVERDAHARLPNDRGNEAAQPGPDRPGGELVLPLLGEEIAVTKRVVETGRVSVRRITREHCELIAEPLTTETVEISRHRVERPVDTMPAVRQEGDTLVIPIVEERLVLERRLILKEEVRVRRVRTSRTHEECVTLRHHDVVVRAMPPKTSPAVPSPAADETPLASNLFHPCP